MPQIMKPLAQPEFGSDPGSWKVDPCLTNVLCDLLCRFFCRITLQLHFLQGIFYDPDKTEQSTDQCYLFSDNPAKPSRNWTLTWSIPTLQSNYYYSNFSFKNTAVRPQQQCRESSWPLPDARIKMIKIEKIYWLFSWLGWPDLTQPEYPKY